MNSRIKEIRETAGLTQEEFGKRIGSARNTIANYENGNRCPSNAVVIAICKEFNINEEWLRFGTGEKNKAMDREQELAFITTSLFKEASDSFKYRLIKALCNMDKAGWESLEKLIDEITKKD